MLKQSTMFSEIPSEAREPYNHHDVIENKF
jgi:hypothetical protein